MRRAPAPKLASVFATRPRELDNGAMFATIAIAFAGAVGPVVVGRLLAVPATVRCNDAAAQACWAALAQWARTHHRALERDLAAKYEVMRARGVHRGGAPVQSRDKATALIEERYRAQLGEARRVLREIASSETLGCRLLRRLRRRPIARFTTPDELTAILSSWRMREPPAPS